MEASSVSDINNSNVANNYGFSAAVQVRRAFKSYQENVPILNNLNMTVPQGSIYSLLGSSGCGKTTMLSCIVGTLKLDSGNVFVFGQKPGTVGSGIPGPEVGYMPQGVTLYGQLSITETLQYFGRISGMSDTEIANRSEFLISFLDLPSPNQRISSLSGGQQRRTSLAVCLLHEPPLLILDEPTVGVDPLIRESIWNHLCDMVRLHNTTVIITTHYIEETRQSNTVGLMRNGRLLTEKSPQILLKEHDSTLLEKIILKLCKKDESLVSSRCIENNSYMPQPDKKPNEEKFKERKANNAEPVIGLSYRHSYEEDDDSNVSAIVASFRKRHREQKFLKWFLKCKAVFIRNLIILLRNPLLLYLAFFCPMLHIILTSFVIGRLPQHIRFGVVNPEINNDFSVCRSNDVCNLKHLSCGYLNALSESKITPVFIDSVEEALNSVQKGNLVGYMEFPHNYSENILNRFLEGRFASVESIEQSTINFKMDMSNYFTGYLLQQGFLHTYQDHVRNFVHSCNQSEEAYKVELPLKYDNPVYGQRDGNYSEGIAIAFLMLLSFFIPGCTSSYAMITDRMQGTLDRTMVAGASTNNVILPYFLSEGFVILVQAGLSCLTVIVFFGWEIQGSMFDFISLLILTGISGLVLGIFISQVVKDLYESIIIFIFLFLINISYVGLLWPIEGNNAFVVTISKLFPMTAVVNAMRSVVGRGWTTTHRYIWPSYGILIASSLILFLLSVKLWRVR